MQVLGLGQAASDGELDDAEVKALEQLGYGWLCHGRVRLSFRMSLPSASGTASRTCKTKTRREASSPRITPAPPGRENS